MKKSFLFVWAIAALALNVYAADSDYTVDANGVITKYAGFDTEVTIPATIGGKKITAIGKEAFRKADLTSVVIPDGITVIDNAAFAENKLTTVTIPGSVKTIGAGAFDENNNLATVVLSEGLEYVAGRNQFGDLFAAFPSTVKSINIPASIRSFDARFGMETVVTFAANINVDMSGVFGRPGIYEERESNPAIFLNYIANDRKAGTYTGNMKCVYKRADGYRYYETQYGAVLTDYYGNTTRVRIPAEIGGIPVKTLYGTFLGSTKIDAVQIPESVTYIGRSTFWAQSLVSITIPASVIYIGNEAFRWGDPDDRYMRTQNNENKLTSVTISAGVQYIGAGAFEGNELASLTIPDTVVYIGAQAFSGNELTSVTIPASVQYIGDSAFADNKLTSVTILNGVTYIGDSAFSASIEESALKVLTIPASVKTMGGVPITEGRFGGKAANNGNSIVIGANVSIEDGSYFAKDYNKNGRKAGRYTASVNLYGTYTWTYSAK
ncbi:hypothetical protein FACS189461_4420 [Spirochaetia bacterium]|nr:hypothetical protein FACS189461_4420 [Spirochaetia bacterium]